MRYLIYAILVVAFSTSSCSKDHLEEKLIVKKDGSFIDEGVLPDYEGCNYLLEPANLPVLQRHANEEFTYTDPDEYRMDRFTILIAQAVHDYASTFCSEGERWEFLSSLTKDSQEDILLDEVFGQYPDLEAHIINYFAVHGEDFQLARNYTLQGYAYVPSLYFENLQRANFNLPAWIGAGVEFQFADSITDYIPMREECENPLRDFYLGKVETDLSGYDPIPEMLCVDNLILIVNWSLDPNVNNLVQKNGAVYAGSVDTYEGTQIDTLLPTPPQTNPNGCAAETAEKYILDRYNFAGLRYDRSRKSEIYISYASQNGFSTGGTLAGNHECDKIDRIKKKKMKNTHNNPNHTLRGFQEDPSLPFNAWQIKDYNETGTMGFYVGVTYERDWYAKHRPVSFDNYTDPVTSDTYIMSIPIKSKNAHEYYQIMFIPKDDWCDQDTKIFGPKGHAVIYCDWP